MKEWGTTVYRDHGIKSKGQGKRPRDNLRQEDFFTRKTEGKVHVLKDSNQGSMSGSGTHPRRRL